MAEDGEGELLLRCIKNHAINNLNTFIRSSWLVLENSFKIFFSGSDPANQLQKLVTGVMPYAKCQQAHADSGSPVLEANNVCAGGEEGMIYVMLIEVFLVVFINFNFDSSQNMIQLELR